MIYGNKVKKPNFANFEFDKVSVKLENGQK